MPLGMVMLSNDLNHLMVRRLKNDRVELPKWTLQNVLQQLDATEEMDYAPQDGGNIEKEDVYAVHAPVMGDASVSENPEVESSRAHW